MRAALLLPLLVAPLAAAHPHDADHGVALVSEAGDGVATRLVAGCAFFAEAALEPGWSAGRLLVLAPDERGMLVAVAESTWTAGANGTVREGPLDVGPGVFLVGLELDGAHGVHTSSFLVECGEPVCPPGGCATLRVASGAKGTPPAAHLLFAALLVVALAGALLVWRG